jgi:hypothetical protein
MIGWGFKYGRDHHHVSGWTVVGTIGDLARFDKDADTNGGHGNDRPT